MPTGPKIKAVATLPIVLLIGGLVAEIGIAGIFMAYYLSQSGLGIKLSEEALVAARAGIQDAKIKIIRNKSSIPNSYTLNTGNRSAKITICKEMKTVFAVCDTPMVGKYEITSLGAALTKRRQIRAMISIDSFTGEIRVESEKEVEI